MTVSREIEADLLCAIAGFPWIDGVYALQPAPSAREDPNVLTIAIVLAPYDIQELVQTHYAILAATGSYDLPGRILYVNGAARAPVPLARARRLSINPPEREAALRRIEERKADAARKAVFEKAVQLHDVELAFRRLAEQAARDRPPAVPPAGSPYRLDKPLIELNQSELQRFVEHAFEGSAIAAPLGTVALEVVDDPFPSPPRKRILLADDDAATQAVLSGMQDVEVVCARDGWTAIDRLTQDDFDLAVVAVVLGGFSGAKIYRLAVNERPEVASRVVFLASESAVSHAPPSSASGRVLARPLNVEAVRALLKK